MLTKGQKDVLLEVQESLRQRESAPNYLEGIKFPAVEDPRPNLMKIGYILLGSLVASGLMSILSSYIPVDWQNLFTTLFLLVSAVAIFAIVSAFVLLLNSYVYLTAEHQNLLSVAKRIESNLREIAHTPEVRGTVAQLAEVHLTVQNSNYDVFASLAVDEICTRALVDLEESSSGISGFENPQAIG